MNGRAQREKYPNIRGIKSFLLKKIATENIVRGRINENFGRLISSPPSQTSRLITSFGKLQTSHFIRRIFFAMGN